jgi:hypothetical protein
MYFYFLLILSIASSLINSLNFVEDKNEIIVGGVGNIRIWTFVAHGNTYELDTPRLCISDLNSDEWVTLSQYVKSGQIYASYDNNVNVRYQIIILAL